MGTALFNDHVPKCSRCLRTICWYIRPPDSYTCECGEFFTLEDVKDIIKWEDTPKSKEEEKEKEDNNIPIDLTSFSMVHDAEYYKECVRCLLVGLEVQKIDVFMQKLSPVNCEKLGKACTKAVKTKLGKL